MDAVLLARIQFALSVGFHYVFPLLTIGMAVVLVYLEAMYVWKREPAYERAAKFWTGIFALNFAIGVATGVVLEFQFGTNWAAYSRFVGDVFGSALAAEGIFAFFLESGFLAVLVFGWERVSTGMHLFATVMVALGSMFSSVWIVAANSWQQTPAGHHLVPVLARGAPLTVSGAPVLRAEVVDFWQVVFNPSFVDRLTHVLVGAFILGSFFIMSISAYYLLRGRHLEFARRSFSGALIFATLGSISALVSGHAQANTVYAHQPAKLAAFEGHYRSGPADLSVWGWPNDDAQTLDWKLAIPGGVSLLVTGSRTGPVDGLDRFRPEDRPPVLLPFATYHLMAGLGAFFIALTLFASFLRIRGRLYDSRWLLWVFVFAVLLPLAANQAGWAAAEVGRQPWVVHPPVPRLADGSLATDASGVVRYDEAQGLRTTRAVSKAVTAAQVAGSLAGLAVVYLGLLAVWLMLLNAKIRKGPAPDVQDAGDGHMGFIAAAAAGAKTPGGLADGAGDADPRSRT
ncbi:MAG: cytochrome ubiquinol oxidase subunit I [Deltaproteobacteria bacterium]|nr:cytochrome ubiquinol oxidase subunit I [Deltaproteobacteria bacterium]